MRKDYIAATEPADHETEFVEKYWTAVWEREGGPDLLPLSRTIYSSKESINPENDGHENKQIQR